MRCSKISLLFDLPPISCTAKRLIYHSWEERRRFSFHQLRVVKGKRYLFHVNERCKEQEVKNIILCDKITSPETTKIYRILFFFICLSRNPRGFQIFTLPDLSYDRFSTPWLTRNTHCTTALMTIL